MVFDNKNSCDLSIGQLVKSKAGRDKGEVFIVLDIVDKNYALIVDGKLRRISNPKKKKIKHLQKTNTILIDFNEKKKDLYFNDSLIRKLIKEQIN